LRVGPDVRHRGAFGAWREGVPRHHGTVQRERVAFGAGDFHGCYGACCATRLHDAGRQGQRLAARITEHAQQRGLAEQQ
jgi:hypothetical protein